MLKSTLDDIQRIYQSVSNDLGVIQQMTPRTLLLAYTHLNTNMDK